MFHHYKNTVGKKYRNMGQSSESLKTDKKMIIPTGKLYGSLPYYIEIDGIEWRCIATASIDGKTYDKIKNIKNGDIKKVERYKLITFLQKISIN